MGFLKSFRSKSRLKESTSQTFQVNSAPFKPSYYGHSYAARMPPKVLENIFSYVCPHTQDLTYEPCERSQIGEGCMLCDMRDLASCARTCHAWFDSAQKLLYSSIRIDAVHYCALEEDLAEKRKKGKHFRSKSAVDAGDIPIIRLTLLARTVRENQHLADQVLILKLPYMTRETAKGDLARAVSVLPNLRYVDLPDGFYTGDSSCVTLRQELQARCPDIRMMSYRPGSEEALELLARRYWQSIEILDISGLAVEPATLRIVLACLPTLHQLTLSNLSWMDDSIFQPSAGRLPDFPPLQVLKLENVPRVTAAGLKQYLEPVHIRESLSSLVLHGTGVTVQDLHPILWAASSLQHLSVVETVFKSLALATQYQLPPLASISLVTLHFEISNSNEVHGLQKPSDSYYTYLASSLHKNALPALQTLFVRDLSFPDLLLMPPAFGFGGPESGASQNETSNNPFGASGPTGPPKGASTFNQTLEIYTKGSDELEWIFTSLTPPSQADGRPGSSSGGRPLSAYSASRGLGPQWAQGGFGGAERRSVIVGNGFGGFLAVPQEEVPRPFTAGSHDRSVPPSPRTGMGDFLKPPPPIGGGSSVQERRSSRHDLWR